MFPYEDQTINVESVMNEPCEPKPDFKAELARWQAFDDAVKVIAGTPGLYEMNKYTLMLLGHSRRWKDGLDFRMAEHTKHRKTTTRSRKGG